MSERPQPPYPTYSPVYACTYNHWGFSCWQFGFLLAFTVRSPGVSSAASVSWFDVVVMFSIPCGLAQSWRVVFRSPGVHGRQFRPAGADPAEHVLAFPILGINRRKSISKMRKPQGVSLGSVCVGLSVGAGLSRHFCEFLSSQHRATRFSVQSVRG